MTRFPRRFFLQAVFLGFGEGECSRRAIPCVYGKCLDELLQPKPHRFRCVCVVLLFCFGEKKNRLGKPSRGDVSSYHPGCCTVSQQPGMLTYVVVSNAVKKSSVNFDISLPVQIQMELSQPLGQNHWQRSNRAEKIRPQVSVTLYSNT